MLHVTESMLHHHNFLVPKAIDPYHLNTPYSSYGLGMSLLFAPLYLLGEHTGGNPVTWAMATNAFVFAATVLVLYWLALTLGGTRRQAVATALLTGFGTLLLPFTSTGFSELGVAFAVALGLVGLSLCRSRPAVGPLLAGIASGVAVLMRWDSLVVVVPFLLAGVAFTRRWVPLATGPTRHWRFDRAVIEKTARELAFFLLGVLPFAAVVAWYNTLRFGAPWRGGYAGQGFTHSWVPGAFGLLLSPGVGLIWYVPLILIAVAGWALAWRHTTVLVVVAVALLVGRIVFYAAWWDWSGMITWGPRLLVPAMPGLAVGLLAVLRRFSHLPLAAKFAVPVIAALSIGIQVVGAAVIPATNSMVQAIELAPHVTADHDGCASNPEAKISSADHALFVWNCFPIADETSQLVHGRAYLTGRVLGPPYHPRLLGGLALLTVLSAGAALLISGDDGSIAGMKRRQLSPTSAAANPDA
jgi:hypothetical protein